MGKVFLISLIFLGFFIAGISPAYALSCRSITPTEALERSTAVFTGRVIDVETPIFDAFNTFPDKVTFEVLEIWKGVSDKILVVRAGNELGYGLKGSFHEGDEVLVYASGGMDRLRTYLCSRTRFLANSQEDLAELGEGLVPMGELPILPQMLRILLLPPILLPSTIILLSVLILAKKPRSGSLGLGFLRPDVRRVTLSLVLLMLAPSVGVYNSFAEWQFANAGGYLLLDLVYLLFGALSLLSQPVLLLRFFLSPGLPWILATFYVAEPSIILQMLSAVISKSLYPIVPYLISSVIVISMGHILTRRRAL